MINLREYEVELSHGELQHDGSRKLLDLIEKQVSDPASVGYDKVKLTDITYFRPHRAILVEGGRGSGKTTFLLRNLERLCTPEKHDPTNAQVVRRVADQVHVFVNCH